MRSTSRSEPRAPPSGAGGSRTRSPQPSATATVTAASTRTAPRQPSASTARPSGTEAAMLPVEPTPTSTAASVAKIAAG